MASFRTLLDALGQSAAAAMAMARQRAASAHLRTNLLVEGKTLIPLLQQQLPELLGVGDTTAAPNATRVIAEMAMRPAFSLNNCNVGMGRRLTT